MFKGKPRFENLDQYVAQRDYALALEAIAEEIKRRPEAFNLLLRQAEILGLAGDREKAIAVYRKLAQHYAEQGFYARAIAVINKVLRLDPNRQDVTKELAKFIAAQQEAERTERAKLRRATGGAHAEPPPAPAPTPAPAPAAPAAPAADAAERQAEKERAASHFFAEFPPPALELLLSKTTVRSFVPPEAIVREGDPGTSFFLIEEGEVEVRTTDPSGRHLLLARLGAGEFFGEVSVLTGRPRTATIVATNSVTVIEIYRDDLDQIAAQYPEVRAVLQRFYERRAQATVEAVIARMRGDDA
ncbi:MAG TPA: cyclic nucleotide-binding domain-containing protein [Thermoanaerobaculaceae bacterium]|nr:cyclic nucleotide-binding domain-containing protein [Thermoanaerobaculaceae bacterium]